MPNKTAGSKTIKRKEKIYYPAYIGVTFNRKTTKFPYEQSDFFQWFMDEDGESFICSTKTGEEIIQELDKARMGKNIVKLVLKLTRQIEYEQKAFGEKYSIVGVHQRVLQYEKKIVTIISGEIKEELLEFLKDELTYRQFVEMELRLKDQLRTDMWFNSKSPFPPLEYLTKDVKLLKTSDIPLAIREKLYYYTLFLSYQEFQSSGGTHIEIMSLFDWLSNPTISSTFLDFVSQNLTRFKGEKAELQLQSIDASKALHYIQSVVSNAVS